MPTSSDEARVQEYKNIARRLVEVKDSNLNAIVDRLVAWRDNDHMGIKPFAVIDAPSLSGKTQLGFALAAVKALKVVHVVMGVWFGDENIQPVYKVFERNSTALRRAVDNDLKSVGTELSASSLRGRSVVLQTVLVIRQLLEIEIVDTCSYDLQSLAKDIQERKSEDRPIFIIDECFYRGESWSLNHLRLLRNILRGAGLICVLMSTNAKASNMLDNFVASRTSDVPSMWCTLFSALPKLSKAMYDVVGLTRALTELSKLNIPDVASFCTFMLETAQTSLPGMVHMVVSVINEYCLEPHHATPQQLCGVMDEIFCRATEKLFLAKKGLHEDQGLQGQLALQLSAYHNRSTTAISANSIVSTVCQQNSSDFVADHFAEVVGGTTDLYIGIHQDYLSVRKGKATERWIVSTLFAAAKENPFLHLLLGGGCASLQQYQRPLQLSRYLSTAQSFVHVDALLSNRQALNAKNEKAAKRSGDWLEAISAISLAMASRLDGLAGTTLLKFLRYLGSELVHLAKNNRAYQLLVWSADETTQSALCGLREESTFGDTKIPYLSAVNSEWPQTLLDIPTLYLGNLRRNKDGDNVDCTMTVAKEEARESSSSTSSSSSSSTFSIRAECKNYEGRISTALLKEILVRIPNSAKIHFAFVSSVQHSYFNKASSSWESWWAAEQGSDRRLPNVAKLFLGPAGMLQLTPLSPRTMPWLSWSECQLVVILVVVESFEVSSLKEIPQETSSKAALEPEEKVNIESTTLLKKRAREMDEDEESELEVIEGYARSSSGSKLKEAAVPFTDEKAGKRKKDRKRKKERIETDEDL